MNNKQRQERAAKALEKPEGSAPSRAFRFSGHQTFALRIAWIPKAVREISAGHDPLNNVDEGIVSLGLGKNMVEALRCWIEAFQVAKRNQSGWTLTDVGELIFSPENGLDPYMEDHSTNWVLHWLICVNDDAPFYAWECVFNRWPTPELTPTQVLDAFHRESNLQTKPVSSVTLKQHWEVFLHNYRPPRGTKSDDNLDSALSILGLIREVGERQNAAGKWESLYAFDVGTKSAICQQLFAYFLHDWWNRRFKSEQTVSVKELVSGDYSPGRLLRMQESEILDRISDLAFLPGASFQITESASLRQLRRLRPSTGLDELRSAYKAPRFL